MSKIEWTEKTWNPIIGCKEASSGCRRCYAAKMAYRLMHNHKVGGDYEGIAKKTSSGRIVFTGVIRSLPARLQQPMRTKKPTVFFVNSMSDLFHPSVDWNYLYKIFEVMALTPHHTYQVLTKHPDIAKKHLPDIWFHLKRNYPDLQLPLKNVMGGVSCENQAELNNRMPHHLTTEWNTHFLSYEPAIGPIDLYNVTATASQLFGFPEHPNQLKENFCALDIEGAQGFEYCLDWVICGGESGNTKDIRPMHPAWARTVRDQCKVVGIPFFFKQWGEWHPTKDHQGNRVIGRSYGRFNGDEFLPGNWVATSFPANTIYMARCGKKVSGALLDGVEHKATPVL